MKCFQFRDLLDEYMDNEIDAVQRKTMNEHAASCPDCRIRLQVRERLFHRLETSQEPDWNIDLADSVMARIRTVAPPITIANPLVKPILLAIIVALFISGILILVGYRSLPSGISPVDMLKLMAGSIEMPSGLRASLEELWSFAGVCWVVFRVLIQIISRIGAIILFKIPGTIPFILVCSVLILGIWRVWRLRRGSTYTNLWL